LPATTARRSKRHCRSQTRRIDGANTAFTFCGDNRVTLEPGPHPIARLSDDPIVATGSSGNGHTAIFASDVAPHWAGDFVQWDGYATFWAQMLG
jgi:uncharacterized membrane protein